MRLDHPIRRALFIAAAYLSLAVAIKLLGQRWLDAATVVRLNGMLMGALVVVMSNTIPKKLVPLSRLACDPAREQALRRFGGWALVLGGLGYLLAFALAPIEIAGTLAICLLAPATAAVAFVVARCAWMRRGAR